MKPARCVLVVLLGAALLALPAVALAKVKRGTYIDTTTQDSIQTNAAATSIKALTIPCVGANASGGGSNQLINKPIKISAAGTFSFSGKSTLKGSFGDSIITLKITGKISGNYAKGTISYPGASPKCTGRTFKAKYYGVNPQG
jgi:hypothetical protein